MFFKLLPLELGVVMSNSCFTTSDQLSFSFVDKYCLSAANQRMSDLLAFKLRKAVLANNLVKAQEYLSIGANPNYFYRESGTTLLHEVAGKLRAEMAKLLIAHGAQISATDINGNTPAFLAMHASCSQQDEATKRLKEALGHSLQTNLDWEKAIAAEQAQCAFYDDMDNVEDLMLLTRF